MQSGAAPGKWREHFSETLAGADVVIVPDNDEAGQNHIEQVARALDGKAARVRVLDLVNLPRKGDVSDWLGRGERGPDDLYALAENTPTWRHHPTANLSAVWYGDEDNEAALSWLVKGLLIDGGLSAVFGSPGSSKTFMVLDLALHVAHGQDWFGKKVATGGVVYVSGEGGGGMRLRMKAWRKEKGGPDRAPFVLVPESVNLFDDDAGAEMLIADVRAHAVAMDCPVRLVVLDTLSRMIGSGDEDKARDINVIVQRAERIQRETGAHVLVVHHSGKDRDRGMRGSNALLGAVDAALEVARFDSGAVRGTGAEGEGRGR